MAAGAGATGGAAGGQALRDVSESFASLLWQEVLRPFQRSLLPGLTGTPAGSLYAGLTLEVLARELARQPGLTDFLCEALAGTAGGEAAAIMAERVTGRKEIGFP